MLINGAKNIHTINKNTEALLVATKETSLEVNAEKTEVHVHVSRTECRTKS
jgi:hypothetical protein